MALGQGFERAPGPAVELDKDQVPQLDKPPTVAVHLAHVPGNALRLGGVLWPWPLVAYGLWVLPVQWLLGRFLAAFLLNAGLILFFCFDLGLPLLAVLTGFARDAE